MLDEINIESELRLIELIFTIPKHSKSSVAWYHRQWIFTKYNNVDIKNELKLCKLTSNLYPRNYYAWTYRYWIVSTYCKMNLDLVQHEYNDTCDWIDKNISDYSGFQYLQQLIHLLAFNDSDQIKHMDWLNNLIIKYPGHESLWCHRRFCSTIFITSKSYCLNQHEFINDIINNNKSIMEQSLSDKKEDFIMQKEYALRFGLFHSLKVIIRVTINIHSVSNLPFSFSLGKATTA